jgi:cytochrome P450
MWKALPAAIACVRYLRKMSERRRISPEDDLMRALVQAEEAGDRLSQDELLAMSFLLLVAGLETTSTSSSAARWRSSNIQINWRDTRAPLNSSNLRSRSY